MHISCFMLHSYKCKYVTFKAVKDTMSYAGSNAGSNASLVACPSVLGVCAHLRESRSKCGGENLFLVSLRQVI